MEQRHDWAKMSFTWELFKYVFVEFIPSVVIHSQSQDEEQVRGHYDRKCFCLSFLSNQVNGQQVVMIFMSGELLIFFFISYVF